MDGLRFRTVGRVGGSWGGHCGGGGVVLAVISLLLLAVSSRGVFISCHCVWFLS